MKLVVGDDSYLVIINRKRENRNTYIRVKSDLTIHVTTNLITSDKAISKLLDENYDKIVDMINKQKTKNSNNDGFYFLGQRYDIVYVTYCDISLGHDRVFMKKNFDIDKWYKKQAIEIFKQHLDLMYNRFSVKIPYPDLRIRKMTTRWGVCNTKSKTVTLNLELIKRDTKYLDYVIVHELSHLIHPNHSKIFWELVSENISDVDKIKKEMKEF